MLFAKEKIDMENAVKVAAFQKKVESESWAQIAVAMVELGSDEYTSGAVEKAYMKEKKDGFPHRNNIASVMAGFTTADGISSGGDVHAQDKTGKVKSNKGKEGDADADIQ